MSVVQKKIKRLVEMANVGEYYQILPIIDNNIGYNMKLLITNDNKTLGHLTTINPKDFFHTVTFALKYANGAIADNYKIKMGNFVGNTDHRGIVQFNGVKYGQYSWDGYVDDVAMNIGGTVGGYSFLDYNPIITHEDVPIVGSLFINGQGSGAINYPNGLHNFYISKSNPFKVNITLTAGKFVVCMLDGKRVNTKNKNTFSFDITTNNLNRELNIIFKK